MTDYNKIMIPVDYSENSPKLLKAAIEVAEKFESELLIVFVVQSFEDYSGFFVPHMPISQFEDEMIESVESLWTDAVDLAKLSRFHSELLRRATVLSPGIYY